MKATLSFLLVLLNGNGSSLVGSEWVKRLCREFLPNKNLVRGKCEFLGWTPVFVAFITIRHS